MSNTTLNSIRQRWILLGAMINNPKKLSRQIMEACKSQGALAKLEISQDGIFKVSLNTLKTSANLAIETYDGKNGWDQLEERRLNVNLLSKSSSKLKQVSQKRPKDARIIELENALDKAHRQRLRVESGYFEVLSILRVLAKSDASLEAKLKRHLATFGVRTLQVLDGGENVDAN